MLTTNTPAQHQEITRQDDLLQSNEDEPTHPPRTVTVRNTVKSSATHFFIELPNLVRVTSSPSRREIEQKP